MFQTFKMKKYLITISTIYGSLVIDDIFANSEEEAIKEAERLAQKELDCSKVGEIHKYE